MENPRAGVTPLSPLKKQLRENQNKHSSFCNPQLRDPLTIAISFMRKPTRFRACCQFTLGVWDQAVYLEGELPCAVGELTAADQDSDHGRLTVPLPLHTLSDDGSKIRAITVKNIPNLCSLDEGCLAFWPLKTAVIYNLPALTEVESCWLNRCSSLESFTIGNLPKLRKVGSLFLHKCLSLTELVFQNLPQLTQVGDHWMCDCTSLQSVTISNLPALSKVGFAFLSNCPSLKFAVFRDLPQWRTVGDRWLSACPALKLLTVVNLTELADLGDQFLSIFDQSPQVESPSGGVQVQMENCHKVFTERIQQSLERVDSPLCSRILGK